MRPHSQSSSPLPVPVRWLLDLDLHVIDILQVQTPGAPGQQSFIFQTRKRTRTVADVVEEGLRSIPFEHSSIREFVARLPEGV